MTMRSLALWCALASACSSSPGAPNDAVDAAAGPEATAAVDGTASDVGPTGIDAPMFDAPEVGLDGSTYVPVPGNCGFDTAPAFCETFEAGPMPGGRAGELDPARWTAIRSAGIDTAFGGGVGKALLDDCRPGLSGAMVLPDAETVICDPVATVPTRHLLTATAAQNYGLNSYRIRQPFDFAGRTGTIKLDVDAQPSALLGWPAIVISQDPSQTPAFDFPERGSGPRNGVSIELLGGWCNDPHSMMPVIFFYRDYNETQAPETKAPASYDCGLPHVVTARGSLNHVEIYLTAKHLEVWASDVSPNGVDFPNFQRLYAGELDLPFERGYVNLIGRNHATIKYGGGPSWNIRWDNVGFDGPVVGGWREYSAPDSLQPTADGQGLTTAYIVPNADTGDTVSIVIPGVSLAGATGAKLAFSGQYPWFEWNGVNHPPQTFDLRWRTNGGPWHDRYISDVEANAFASFSGDIGATGAGLLSQTLDLELAELRDGDNVLELAGANTWTGTYRIGVVGIDLVLATSL